VTIFWIFEIGMLTAFLCQSPSFAWHQFIRRSLRDGTAKDEERCAAAALELPCAAFAQFRELLLLGDSMESPYRIS
jgi:hypothetical protein